MCKIGPLFILTSGHTDCDSWVVIYCYIMYITLVTFGLISQLKSPAAKLATALDPISVTRLGDVLHFGQLYQACGNNYFTQIAHIFRQFWWRWSFIFSTEIIYWATFIDIWRIFTGHTGLYISSIVLLLVCGWCRICQGVTCWEDIHWFCSRNV